MLHFPPKFAHAVEAVVYIASASGVTPVSSAEIADALNLPGRHLEPIMQKLVRAGVLSGMRGPRGGYLLARERRRIRLADIAAALGEDEEKTGEKPSALAQLIQPVLRAAEAKAEEALREVTLAELCARLPASPAKIPASKRRAARADFTI